jgi:hypothetical protein
VYIKGIATLGFIYFSDQEHENTIARGVPHRNELLLPTGANLQGLLAVDRPPMNIDRFD